MPVNELARPMAEASQLARQSQKRALKLLARSLLEQSSVCLENFCRAATGNFLYLSTSNTDVTCANAMMDI